MVDHTIVFCTCVAVVAVVGSSTAKDILTGNGKGFIGGRIFTDSLVADIFGAGVVVVTRGVVGTARSYRRIYTCVFFALVGGTEIAVIAFTIFDAAAIDAFV